jgi:hypothetical protein
MSLRKKAPKGITQADWNKIKAIYALIDNDIIMRDPMMASYTDAPSYSGNKGKGAKEFIKHYHEQYKGLFKKGKAGDKLEKYIASTKGRMQVKAQLQKYQDEGIIDLPDYRISVQQDKMSAQDLGLSGGIFDSLKGAGSKDPFSKASTALDDTIFPLALSQSAAGAQMFEDLFARNTEDANDVFVQYNTLKELIDDDEKMYAGPARVTAANFQRQLSSQVTTIENMLKRFDTDDVIPMSTVRRLRDFFNKAKSLADIIGDYVDSSLLNDKTEFSLKKDDSMTWSDIKSGIASSNPRDLESSKTAANAIKYLVKGKLGNTDKKAWANARPKMLQRQQEGLFDLRTNIRDLYDKSTIAQELLSAYEQAKSAQRTGGLDEKQYRTIEKMLQNVRKQADSLPTIGQLVDAMTDGDLTRVRDANYKAMVVKKTIENITSQIGLADKVSKELKKKKNEGWTTHMVIDALQKVYNAVSPVLMVKPEDLQKGDVGSRTFVYTSGSNDVNATRLASAKSSVRNVRDALTRARRAGLDQALQIYLHLQMMGAETTFKKNLKIAYDVSQAYNKSSMTEVVNRQEAGLEKLEKGAHIRDRLLRFYLPTTPWAINQFLPGMGGGAQKKVNAANVLANNDSLKKLLGSDSLSRIPEDVVDPRKVFDSLPSKLKSMSRDQAKAMAESISEYMRSIFGRFTSVVSTQQTMMSGGLNYRENQKSLDRQVQLLTGILKDSKFDNSAKLNELPRNAAGLFSVGFLPKMKEDGKPRPTLAVMSPDDLLMFDIFKGDTFVQGDELRSSEYPMMGFASSQKKSMLQSAGSSPYLAKRPVKNSFGKIELIDWSPLDAEDLRNRYFIAMYPYDLRNAELNKMYQQKLRGKTYEASKDTVFSDFGLTDGSGSSNRRGNFNRW